MNVERFVTDGIAVTEWVRSRLHTQKVVLMGSSWGTMLGVMMVRRRPELFAYYVGTSQAVSGPEGGRLGYQLALEAARTRNDAAAVTALERIGPPPYSRFEDFLVRQQYTNPPGLPPTPEEAAATAAIGALLSAPPPPNARYIAQGLGPYDMWSVLLETQRATFTETWAWEARDQGLAFEVPILIIQGDHDLNAPVSLARAWFDELSAPTKTFEVIVGAGPQRARLFGPGARLAQPAGAACRDPLGGTQSLTGMVSKGDAAALACALPGGFDDREAGTGVGRVDGRRVAVQDGSRHGFVIVEVAAGLGDDPLGPPPRVGEKAVLRRVLDAVAGIAGPQAGLELALLGIEPVFDEARRAAVKGETRPRRCDEDRGAEPDPPPAIMKDQVVIVVDLGCGALRGDIGDEGVGLAEQQQGLVDQMRPQIIEQAGALGRIVLPALPDRRPEAVPVHFAQRHFAEAPGLHQLADGQEVAVPTAIVEGSEQALLLLGHRDQRVGFGHA